MRPILALMILWGAANSVAAQTTLVFERDVRPILKAQCFECHGEGKKLKGSLDLRLRRFLDAGGDTGPAIVPGKAANSLLIERVRSGEMPPGKRKLTAAEVAVLEQWIDAGGKVEREEPKDLPVGFNVLPDEAAFWSFQPIAQPTVPIVKNTGRVRTPIDAFLLANLEAKGAAFGPEANRRTLIRRATLDLHGLPPTPAQVDAFVNDPAADAYEALIDRLLASPRYAERWARHWLDVAGYADSEGFTGVDPLRPSAWRYRDYVVRAFQGDMPWDRFIAEQLAGDEMVRPPYEKLPSEDLDKLTATGFLRMAPDGTASAGVDAKVASNQNIADTLQIVSSSLLGVTLHCAQCHNHRYDPIPQLDYYRMRAVFEPALDWKAWRAPAAREVPIFTEAERLKADAIEKDAAAIDAERAKKVEVYVADTFAKQLERVPEDVREQARQMHATAAGQRTAEQNTLMTKYPFLNVTSRTLSLYNSKAETELKTYSDKAAKLRATKPVPMTIRALTESTTKIPETRLFERGDYESPRDAVTPAHLTVLGSRVPPIAVKDAALPTTGRRLAFARGLTSGDHPLTARVLVNRFWMHHFGKGIVATPSDFGFLGERPTHPELLDWLASDFMAGGWRLKRLHRTIMTSTAYRQAAERRPDLERIDPDNRLLGRFSIRRLDAESLRDSVLTVSGKLNVQPFGPPIVVTQDEVGQIVIGNSIRNPGDGTPKGKVASLGGAEFRRSLWVQVRRSTPLGLLETFDGAALTPNCESRNASTVSTQSLLLMNSSFVHELAEYFAARVQAEAGAELDRQVNLAWRLAFGAEPNAQEQTRAVAFLVDQTAAFRGEKGANNPQPSERALANLCQALLSSNRFLYVD
jgi:hypothetical protein